MINVQTVGRVNTPRNSEGNLVINKKEETGTLYTHFSFAVNEGPADNQTTTWFDCVAFNGTAQRLVNAGVRKGSLLQLSGRFSTDTHTNDAGVTTFKLKLQVTDFGYVPVAKSNGAAAQAETPAEAAAADDGLPF